MQQLRCEIIDIIPWIGALDLLRDLFTRSATRASLVENTFSRVAMPDNKNTGVSATWMM